MDAGGEAQPDFASLYEAAGCALLLLDAGGTIRVANDRFCAWSGYRKAELIGQLRLVDLLTMGGRIFYQTHWAPLLQIQGSVSEVKFMLRHRDGHELPMMLNAVRITHERASFDHVAAFVVEDRHRYERELLSERQRAERLLDSERSARAAADEAQGRLNVAHSDRALLAEQMIGIVSHDLRNPLSAISVSAALLGMGELTTSQRRVVGRIVNSTERAQRMVADLLDFTQARVGQGLAVSPRSIDLKQVVSEGVDELSTAFPGRQLVCVHEGTGECRADPDRLVQLVGNLVANALTYGAVGQPVTVTSLVRETTFEVSVHNFGAEVPADRVATLFEPMSRGTSAASGSRNVGLGLFIVREIARAHGGEVRVASSADAGTTFTARFPR